ncbi:MAG: beta-galactosidase [Armatimonadaceae bacterium]
MALQNRVPIELPGILYGGDYNPDQWSPDVWTDDIRWMQEANVNIATLPVFGWVSLQPDEDTFTFEWLDDILNRMADAGIAACLATATASQPAWVDQKYPDVLITDANGVRRRHGNRHSFCPTSPNYRRLSTTLARKIAERYKDHPALLLWHINNEYGTYCYCDLCAGAFREWLQVRYGSLDELNNRWYTRFWGHVYTDWSQVEPSYANGEGAIQALKLDYYRFQSDSLLNCYKAEAEILREVTPHVPITTNLMGTFFPLNYHRWAQEMDIVSWDNYPRQGDPPANVAFTHTVMRGLREGQPFLLMEQSPSQQNWQRYNTVKAPGELRRQSFQAVAQGADSVMYFQWRRGRGGIEKLHGAIIEHSNRTDTRVFREVSELGAELQALGQKTLGGRVPAKVAILFDWENWWSLRFSSGPTADLDYVAICRAYYTALYHLGIPVNVLSPHVDLSDYEVIIAPTLTMFPADVAEKVAERVRSGATFVASVFSGLVDENDLVHPGGPPGPLRDLLGLWVEETDAVMPEETHGLRLTVELSGVETGFACGVSVLCDRVRLESAEPVAVYTADFYAGEPVVTRNVSGSGAAYYIASHPDASGLQTLLGAICREKGIVSPLADGVPPPVGVEVSVRVSPEGTEVLYLLNHSDDPVEVLLPEGTYTDLLTGNPVPAAVPLPAGDVAVVAKNTQ